MTSLKTSQPCQHSILFPCLSSTAYFITESQGASINRTCLCGMLRKVCKSHGFSAGCSAIKIERFKTSGVLSGFWKELCMSLTWCTQQFSIQSSGLKLQTVQKAKGCYIAYAPHQKNIFKLQIQRMLLKMTVSLPCLHWDNNHSWNGSLCRENIK